MSALSSTAELIDERARRLADSRSEPTTATVTSESGDALAELTAEIERRLSRAEPTLRRIRLDEPAAILDRLVEREPVHPLRDRVDLADRLDEDRRCFVLEHPELPGRPMNVVWVALWDGIARSIDEVLDPEAPCLDPGAADTAVFYSIGSIEPGLRGIPGGRSLLDAAMDELRSELGALRTFVTLSPIPGFRDWTRDHPEHGVLDAASPADGPMSVDSPTLRRACVEYLLSARPDGRPLDPVARFHMGNGARLLAVNDHANRSERGREQSFEMMANYRYAPESLEQNRLDLRDGRPAVGPAIEAQLRGGAADRK